MGLNRNHESTEKLLVDCHSGRGREWLYIQRYEKEISTTRRANLLDPPYTFVKQLSVPAEVALMRSNMPKKQFITESWDG